uniref:Uncharacterized protein n=1 Tax=Biomphalaria glabrata TaxID=6526 RepID=A0A2C9KB34_BIOGL
MAISNADFPPSRVPYIKTVCGRCQSHIFFYSRHSLCELLHTTHQFPMAIFAVLACLLVLAVPSLQQGGHGHGGYRDHAYCYDQCNNAYQKNRNSYNVDQCNCNGYNFPGHNNCGHIDASCIANSYDATYNVYAWTYDHRSNSCKKVSVLSRCVDSYTPQRNIFQTQQACVRACEPNRGY